MAQKDIDKDPYYMPGDYIGDIGIEHTYEEYLRGSKGAEVLMRDALGRIQGRYEDGALDRDAVAGKNIKLSLNIELQQYAESLMVNKKGAVVAIEPSTGEILCLVSAPSYDPRLLVGRERGKNYNEMMRDLDKPLFNRAIQAVYPPGSTFKPTQGLILLEENIITTGTMFPCAHGFISGGLRVGCHGHGSPLPLKPALQTSCNAYFCWGFKAMIDKRSKYGSSANAFEIWKTTSSQWATATNSALTCPANTEATYQIPKPITDITVKVTGAPTLLSRFLSARERSLQHRCR